MKKLVAVAVVVVSLCAASVAFASYLSMHRARHASLHKAKITCRDVNPCRFYGLDRCVRISGSKVDCKVFYELRKGGKRTCTNWLDWKLDAGGLKIHEERYHCRPGWRY